MHGDGRDFPLAVQPPKPQPAHPTAGDRAPDRHPSDGSEFDGHTGDYRPAHGILGGDGRSHLHTRTALCRLAGPTSASRAHTRASVHTWGVGSVFGSSIQPNGIERKPPLALQRRVSDYGGAERVVGLAADADRAPHDRGGDGSASLTGGAGGDRSDDGLGVQARLHLLRARADHEGGCVGDHLEDDSAVGQPHLPDGNVCRAEHPAGGGREDISERVCDARGGHDEGMEVDEYLSCLGSAQPDFVAVRLLLHGRAQDVPVEVAAGRACDGEAPSRLRSVVLPHERRPRGSAFTSRSNML
jgi:hypothetical protein